MNTDDKITEIYGDVRELVGITEGFITRFDAIDKKFDSFTVHKNICDKKFSILDAHRNKVMAIAAMAILLAGYAISLSV